MDDTMTSPDIDPLPFWQAVPYFLLPGLIFALTVWGGIPVLVRAGLAEFTGYLIALGVPLVGMFVAALVALKREGYALTWESFRERYRYRKTTGRDWLWAFGGFVVMLVGYGAVSQLSAMLVNQGLMPVPESVPTVLDPRLSTDPSAALIAAAGDLQGRWDLVVLYFVVLFFNIAAEELWWRGYLLPRQEAAHGKNAWLLHGLMWAAFHFFKWWDILNLIPVTLAIAFVSQRRGNNWPAVVMHAIFNGVSLLGFVALVAGLGP